MKRNHILLIIGGDLRQVEVVNILAPRLDKIYLVGFDLTSFPYSNVHQVQLEEVSFSKVNSILLPIPGIHEDGIVETKFSNKKILFTKELLEQTKPDCTIYSGIITPYLAQITKQTNRKIAAIFDRDDVAILNSIPTAEGALMLAIQHTDITIHQSQVIVLGFGRVGMTVARLFASVGALVSVYARKQEHIARITEMGLTAITPSTLEGSLTQQNIIINTVPSLILTSTLIKKLSLSSFIIDLASKPGGTDFDSAKEHQIKTIWPLGLPAKVAPKTAGKIIGQVLLEMINE
ncbi:dipicolinate synthase subunit DpsA [Bacillus sp. B1-b2]|uniref:dipicolinate synthase subunit DpsA n=1 Tax=Bacillus sp. B1-b2 TaxID=2653201 RepID=UPI0012624AFF|nr:dipicolinate synthase subunit DpsA [Bacillus sp. B1-b2]KAB7666282.1 dipicolinate synthase subunit DpsA [Bacillus sp. B1-b2]